MRFSFSINCAEVSSLGGLSDGDFVKVRTFGIWGAWVGGFLSLWSHRKVIFGLRTRVGAPVGIFGSITKQKGKEQISYEK